MKFLCSGCGACCKAISCSYLTSEMRCSIYETRPDICDVQKMADIRGVDRMSWFIQNTLFCHSLIDYYGMSEDYKIDILDYVTNKNREVEECPKKDSE